MDTQVLFNTNEVLKQVSVNVTDDGVDEASEAFTLALSASNPPSTLLPSSQITITIADDDPTPVPAPDRDGDGVPDSSDNCANVANADQADGDADGIGKACDVTEVSTAPPPPPPLKTGNCANEKRGTSGDDALAGTSAGDRLLGLAGDDGLTGLAGNDCLDGGSGGDFLSGGPGNDTLTGGTGDDRLSGAAGNDSINVGRGVNVVLAGAGNDKVNAKNRKRDVIDCGKGRDTVTADRADRLRGCETVKR